MPSSSPTLRSANSSSSSLPSGTQNAAGSAAPALRYYMRKPSRKALYVQPPHWLLEHLSIFRLELVDHPAMPPPMSHASLGRLCHACLERKPAAKRKLVETVLARPRPSLSRQAHLDMADEVLSSFLYWTVYSFTPSLGQALVMTTARSCMGAQRFPYEPIHFQLGKESVEILPDFWVSIKGCPRFAFMRDSALYAFTNKRNKGEKRWQKVEHKLDHDDDPLHHDPGLKPRDGAVLITIAQEKRRHGVLDPSGGGVWSHVFTPATDRRALFLHAAYFPLAYLDAIRHLSRPLEPAICVHRYRISIYDDAGILALLSTLMEVSPPQPGDAGKEEQAASPCVVVPVKHPLRESNTNSNTAKRRKIGGDCGGSLVSLECGGVGGQAIST